MDGILAATVWLTRHAASRRRALLGALAYTGGRVAAHGGIAMGFDRVAMLLCGELSIRDVIGFPKTQKGVCAMSSAPSPVDEKQLRELGMKLDLD